MTTLRSVPPIMRSAGLAELANSNGRIVRYVFSTPAVARDGHTIQGWDVANFLTNPVFLWAHEADALPVGKVVDLDADARGLRGGVQYATAEENPFADTVYRLVTGGYLNATSVSWLPLEWSFSKDKSRPGGIDFKLAELLEISQVPVPAQPEALATARAAGIDTGPLFRWAEKVLDQGSMILVPRDELEQLRREAKMPANTKTKPTVEEETPPAPVTQIPPAPAAEGDERARAARAEAFKRSLWDVGDLAYLLMQMAWTQQSLADEAEWEQDGSELPGQLAALAAQLGEFIKALTGEEVDELIARLGGDETARAARTEMVRTLFGLDEGARAGLLAAARHVASGKVVTITVDAEVLPLSRAGKALSSDREARLREIHGAMADSCEQLLGLIDDATADSDDDDASRAADAAAARKRKAAALKRRLALATA